MDSLGIRKAEDRIQQECVIWFNNEYCRIGCVPRWLIFHVPNQNQQHLVSIGVLSGVSDLVCVCGLVILWIEIKTPTGGQSPAQIDFQQRVEALGYQYHIVRSLDAFKTIIQSI